MLKYKEIILVGLYSAATSKDSQNSDLNKIEFFFFSHKKEIRFDNSIVIEDPNYFFLSA